MKSASYFPHDSNARNDSKLIRLRMRHGAAGYGVYFMLLERLRDEQGYVSAKDYEMIAFDLRVDTGLVRSVVEDFGLFAFTDDGDGFCSESFSRRMSVKDDVSKARAESGRRGAEKRWAVKPEELSENGKNGKIMANAIESDGKTMAFVIKTDSKESKEKKEKEREREREKAPGAFLPPSPEEISSFIRAEGLAVDAERFFNFYEGNGWMMGRSKMRDWQAALRAWAAREPRDKPPKPAARIPTAEEIAARDEAERKAKAAERAKCISWDEYKRRKRLNSE